jgi:hypothetical protein
LTALNRIFPDDYNYADNIVKSILNLDSLSTCNALLSLSGYKPFGRTKYHECLRDIDEPPVPFSQLVTNIEIVLKAVKQRGTGVKASYCLIWLDNYTKTNDEDLSNYKHGYQQPIQIVSKVLRSDYKKNYISSGYQRWKKNVANLKSARLHAMPIDVTSSPDFVMANATR